jgi:hypothetical protein
LFVDGGKRIKNKPQGLTIASTLRSLAIAKKKQWQFGKNKNVLFSLFVVSFL